MRSSEVKKDLYKLGLYQVIGGSISLLIGILSVFSNNIVNIILLFLIILLCSFSIYCGYLCLKGREEALKLSLGNQAIQVFHFSIPLLGFKYASGLYTAIGISLGDEMPLRLDFGLFKLAFQINKGNGIYEFSINLIALFLVFWIARVRKKVREAESHYAAADLFD